LLRRVDWYEFINVSEVLVASIRAITAMMMDAVSTSETSVNFHQTTRRYNPEDSHLRFYYKVVAIHLQNFEAF
jgi:hypothetical protein